MGRRVAVSRHEHFNAAHRLHNPEWDDARNREVFGKCNLPHYHGHNYEIIVRVTGETDEASGYVMDMKVLSDLIKQHVIERFDHRNLNEDVPEFRHLNPSAENIVVVIHDILRALIAPSLELKITLYETPRNFVEYPA